MIDLKDLDLQPGLAAAVFHGSNRPRLQQVFCPTAGTISELGNVLGP
jgi:hypothetical protein